MRILTNDPSFRAWGYAVIEISEGRTRVLEVGCIKTEAENKLRRIRKADDTTRRTSEIVRELLQVINRHQVSYIVSEAVHGSQSASAAVMMGVTVGIMQTLAISIGCPIEWYSESDAKKNLTGRKSVPKTKMIKLIKDLYGFDWPEAKYKKEAIADAMAIFHCAIIHSEVLRYHKLQQQPKPKVFQRTK